MVSEWIDINDELPDVAYGYFLVTRKYHDGGIPHVCYSFYTKDRYVARSHMPYYSRKVQGKNSVHFTSAEAGFVVTHWMPLPDPAKQ